MSENYAQNIEIIFNIYISINLITEESIIPSYDISTWQLYDRFLNMLPVWHHLITKQSDQIKAIQKRAIRIIYRYE